MLKRRHPDPRLPLLDRLFWQIVRRCWSGWKQALLVVTPETLVRWHRAGFRWYWMLISKVRKPLGRRPISQEVRNLIFRMVAENPTWGAPRIHGELLMLAFDVSERTISRWIKRTQRNPDPAKRWITFLRQPQGSDRGDGFLHRSLGHLRPAAGGIWALREGLFKSPAVIRMIEIFTKAITESNYFWHGKDFGEEQRLEIRKHNPGIG